MELNKMKIKQNEQKEKKTKITKENKKKEIMSVLGHHTYVIR